MKVRLKITFGLLLLFCSTTFSQTTDKSKTLFNKNTYYRQVNIFDPSLCNKDSLSKEDCYCFEYYFTTKGNLIYKPYCKNESVAYFYIGTYYITDTGLVCQLNKKYFIKTNNAQYAKEDSSNPNITNYTYETDYNKGKLKKCKSYSQFIPKNNCSDFPYATRDYIYTILGKKTNEDPAKYHIASGKVFELNTKYEAIFLEKINKSTILKDL